jgi:hypothetical protein
MIPSSPWHTHMCLVINQEAGISAKSPAPGEQRCGVRCEGDRYGIVISCNTVIAQLAELLNLETVALWVVRHKVTMVHVMGPTICSE